MEPLPTEPEPRAAESVAARAEEGGAVLGYAARPAGARRVWRWIRPGSVLFFVLVTALAVGAGWRVWKWRLAADRKAFEGCATIPSSGGVDVIFTRAPSRAALRHLSRVPGPINVYMDWPESENAAAAEAFRAADPGNVSSIAIGRDVNVDLLLKELSRPDSRLKALNELYLSDTQVTDAGLKELARSDGGLKALATLSLGNTQVTDAGLKELARSDSGLKALDTLELSGTPVTDAGLKELSRPDSGLKALSTLYLHRTPVTDAGVKALEAARPGLKIRH
jgi:hypothetical protein